MKNNNVWGLLKKGENFKFFAEFKEIKFIFLIKIYQHDLSFDSK